MRRWLPLSVLGLLAASAAFWYTRQACQTNACTELSWLTDKLQLTPEQAREVERLQASYEPTCAGHCQRLGSVKARLRSLSANGGTGSPEFAAAQAELKAIEAECNRATREHVEAVAKILSPSQADQFRALVLPQLAAATPTSLGRP